MVDNDRERTAVLNESFFAIAKKLNSAFSVIPVLFGSLGLQELVSDDLSPGDIDMCVPLFMLTDRFDDLAGLMQNDDYEAIDYNEKRFLKGDIQVEFCVIDDRYDGGIPNLHSFAGIKMIECPVFVTNGAVYKNLTLAQHLAVYTSSQEDEHQKGNAIYKDQMKIDIIHKALSCNKSFHPNHGTMITQI